VENLLPKGMLGTQRRTVIAGVVALVLAIILLLVYLNHYRNSVRSANASTPVLRAKVFVPAGTTALTLAHKGLYEVAAIPKAELKDGAVTDASAIHGEVALVDIYPGQQLVETDFGASATSSALSGSAQLLGAGPTAGTYRALAISLDSTRGIVPQVLTGDHVDVYVQMNGRMGLLRPNVLVLQAPNQTAAGTTASTSNNYILRIPSRDAAKWAFAAQNGTIWFTLRPQTGAKPVLSPPASSSTDFFVGQ
jgi:Flp pilus assembly protein CpaB